MKTSYKFIYSISMVFVASTFGDVQIKLNSPLPGRMPGERLEIFNTGGGKVSECFFGNLDTCNLSNIPKVGGPFTVKWKIAAQTKLKGEASINDGQSITLNITYSEPPTVKYFSPTTIDVETDKPIQKITAIFSDFFKAVSCTADIVGNVSILKTDTNTAELDTASLVAYAKKHYYSGPVKLTCSNPSGTIASSGAGDILKTFSFPAPVKNPPPVVQTAPAQPATQESTPERAPAGRAGRGRGRGFGGTGG